MVWTWSNCEIRKGRIIIISTKNLVPSTWYQVLGTNYDYSPFPDFTIWPGPNHSFRRFDFFRVIGSDGKDNRHTTISFCICWWGSWVLVTSEVPRHMNDDSGIFVIPRSFWAFQEPFGPGPGPMGPMGPGPGPMGPYRALYGPIWLPM